MRRANGRLTRDPSMIAPSQSHPCSRTAPDPDASLQTTWGEPRIAVDIWTYTSAYVHTVHSRRDMRSIKREKKGFVGTSKTSLLMSVGPPPPSLSQNQGKLPTYICTCHNHDYSLVEYRQAGRRSIFSDAASQKHQHLRARGPWGKQKYSIQSILQCIITITTPDRTSYICTRFPASPPRGESK